MAKKDFMSLMKEKTIDVRPSVLSAEENIKSQIVVLDSLRDLIPPLTDEELFQLEQNLVQHGVKDPLTLWETTGIVAGINGNDSPVYILVDGHNRYQFIKKHQLDFRLNLLQFTSLDDVREYMIDYQLGRRNLTLEQASYLRGLRYLKQKTARGGSAAIDTPRVNVSETLAKEFGVSSRTIKRDGEYAASLQKLDPGTRREVLAGKQKMPRSKIYSLPGPEMEQTIEADGESKSKSLMLAAPLGHKRVTHLQSQIRELTNSDLTHQSCVKLLEKATELLTLLSPK